jgi:hypothetical protein
MATKRIIAKKSVISTQAKKRNQTRFYSVPELKENGNKDIPVFKVKTASLDDQIKAHELSQAPNRLMIRFMESMRDGKEIDYAEFRKQLYYDDLHPKTVQACEIFQRCVLQPKFKINEVFKLSETHPDLVNDIAAFALGVEEGDKNGSNK